MLSCSQKKIEDNIDRYCIDNCGTADLNKSYFPGVCFFYICQCQIVSLQKKKKKEELILWSFTHVYHKVGKHSHRNMFLMVCREIRSRQS